MHSEYYVCKMEYPHLGEHCSVEFCKRLDFLPVKCDACEERFCSNHMSYDQHNCPSAYKKNVQVPVCPLCNSPVPVQKGELPDIIVGNHIDNDCKSDAAQRKKVFTNKCTMKGCKTKEIVPVICNECRQNFCFKHRHIVDHDCAGMKRTIANAALNRQRQNRPKHNENQLKFTVQGSLSDDEALAKALQLSLENSRAPTRNSVRSQQLCALS